jgi:hypothetical protein
VWDAAVLVGVRVYAMLGWWDGVSQLGGVWNLVF